MPQDLVTIVIPTFNQLHHTKACLAALQKTLSPVLRARVHIIDNASQDGTQDYLSSLEKEWPLLRWWGLKENRGFNEASNLGAEKADSEFLVFLNNDTIPQAGWLEALLEPMRNSRIGIVGPKLVFPESGLINHAGYVMNRGLGGFYAIYQSFHHEELVVNRAREYQALLGACLLMRRSLFMEVGGFDEFGLEDIALCLKVREKGLGVLYYPKSVVFHVGSATIKGEPQAYLVTDSVAFNERWPIGSLRDDDVHYYRRDGYSLAHASAAEGIRLKEDFSESFRFVEEAKGLREMGKTMEGIDLGLRAIALYPHNSAANLLLMEMYVEIGKLEEAKRCGVEFLSIEPWNFPFYEIVFQLMLAVGDQEGLRRLRDQAMVYPDFPKKLLEDFSK